MIKTYTDTELIDYLLAQNISLIPIVNKHPFKKKAYEDSEKFTNMYNSDWVEYLNLNSINEYGAYLKRLLKYPGYGFSVVLHSDFLVVDFDPGHKQEENMLPPEEQRSVLIDLLDNKRTLYARKPNSKNLHLFYKPISQSIRTQKFFEEKSVAGDVFTWHQHIRVSPDYYFANLDLSKDFIEQMADTPEYIQNWARQRDLEEIKKAEKYKNIEFTKVSKDSETAWMMRKITRWSQAGRFDVGARHDGVLKFSLSCLYKGIDPMRLEAFMDQFATECFGGDNEDVLKIVRDVERHMLS